MFQEWASARNFWNGLPVYTSHAVTYPLYAGAAVPEKRFFMEHNHHPPSAVLLALPLAALSYPAAHVTWNVLSLAAFVVSLGLIVRQLRVPLTGWLLAPAGVLLLSYPMQQQLIWANWNLFFLSLLTGLWLSARAGRPAWAGLCLGLLVAIKLSPAILALFFLARRDWRVLAWGGAWLSAILLVTAVVLGPHTCWHYATEVCHTINDWRGVWCNYSLAGFWSKLFAPTPKTWLILPVLYSPLICTAGTVAGCGLVAGGLYLVARRARSQADWDLAFGLAVIALTLVSPVTWIHSALLLVLPIILLWLRLPRWGFAPFILWGSCLLLWLSDFANASLAGLHLSLTSAAVIKPRHCLGIFSLPTYALLALFLLGCWVALGRPTRESRRTQELPPVFHEAAA